MKNTVFILALLICTWSLAQSSDDAKLAKVYASLDKNKIDKAEEQLEKILGQDPSFGKGWDLMANIRSFKYKQAKSQPNILGNLTVTTTDKDGNQISAEEDTLGQNLLTLLQGINPAKTAYNKWLYTLRKGTLLSTEAFNCSIVLRNELHLNDVDTLINEEAMEFYNQAENAFSSKNYNEAANLYKKALAVQPEFYKAQLYLADSYYMSGFYGEASKYFKECSEKYPNFLEPKKYLVDAYFKDGLMDLVLKESAESFLIYPDPTMERRMELAANDLGKQIVVLPIQRMVFPNKIASISEPNYDDPNPLMPQGYWTNYASAIEKIKSFCDDQGIITKENELTDSQYLEVYSWEEMLLNNNDPVLATAKDMYEKGFLDCYALITNFHDDLYDQYLHFVTNNRKKVLTYFEQHVVRPAK